MPLKRLTASMVGVSLREFTRSINHLTIGDRDMKKIAAVSTNEIARISAKNIVLNHVDMLTATSKGIQLETMKKRMMRGEVVRFAYMKLDGSVRVAVGTLQPQAVKANVVGTGIPKRFYGMFAYLDLEKMAWRGFREENFIGTIEN
jgi:hypothetical protein